MAATVIAPRSTIVDALSRRRGLAYQLSLIVGGSLLIAVLAQVAIPLPFTPVPITGQTYAVLLVGAALGSRRGALSVLLYVVEGGLGLPFFAGAASGWGRLLGPTGGYLAGFVLAAWLAGWLAERGWDSRFRTAVLAMAAAQLVIYAVGVAWLAVFVGPGRVLPLGVVPFLPGDLLKMLLAAATLPAAWMAAGSRGRAR